MNSIRCCVPKCHSDYLVSHHRFPKPNKDKERFEKWLELINNEVLLNLDPATIYNNKRVCRLHFENKYFSLGNKRLHNNAIPTLGLIAGTEITTCEMEMPMTICSELEKEVSSSTPYINVIDLQSEHNYSLASGSSSDLPQVFVATETEHTSMKREKVNTPKHILKRCGISSQIVMTPRKSKMYSEIKRIYRKYNSTRNSKLSFKRRLFEAQKFSVQKLDDKLENFNTMAALFIRCQFREIAKSKKLHRFTLEEKLMALSLYKQSRKTYHFLSNIFVLPSRSTIERLINKINIGPGINACVFEALEEVAKRMHEHDKFVALLFDEMSIMPFLNYNEHKGIIEGFEDVMGQRTSHISDHVLMFMIRSIKTNKKSPVCYNFTSRGGAKTNQIKLIIIEILENLVRIGLKPITIICDQVGNNFSAIRSIMNETKADYLSKNVPYPGGFFEVAGFKIYPLLDPPHLLKGIRNNFIKKNIIFYDKNIQKLAKWEHIRKLYEEDTGCAIAGLKALPQLTDEHIYSNKLRKMKVKQAAQIFSHRVASTLMLASRIDSGQKIGARASETSELLLFFDRLFDSVNGGRKNAEKGKSLRCGLSDTSEHIHFWVNDALPLLSKMEFQQVKKRDQKKPPSLKNWIFTIQNFMQIWEALKSEGFLYILPRNFNQDPLENFFGRVRSFGGHYKNPSPSMCIGIFKALFINFACSSHKKTFNCEDDKSENILMPLKIFLKSENTAISECEDDLLSITALQPQHKILLTLTQKLSILAKNYVAGFLLKKIKKMVLTCPTCSSRLFLEDGNISPEHELIVIRENGNGWHKRLCYPTVNFTNTFYDIVKIIQYHLLKKSYSINLVQSIKNNIKKLISFDSLLCADHKVLLSVEICQLIIRTILHNWCKDVNKQLNGKDSRPYLGKNEVLVQANVKYLKSLKRKKNM